MRSARVLAQTWKAVSESAAEFSTRAVKERKVAVLGAAGGIGQPLSLLMKVRAYCC
jgi:malate dehydrogenase